jgi:hypothetical protein
MTLPGLWHNFQRYPKTLKMKHVLFLSIFPCLLFAKTDVPEVVKAAFAKKYPQVKKMHWQKRGDLYEGEYREGKKEIEAVFREDGTWLYTMTEIDRHKLPVMVVTGFRKTEFADWKLDEAGQVETEKFESAYLIEVEKGDQEYDLIFKEDGTLLEKQIVRKGK